MAFAFNLSKIPYFQPMLFLFSAVVAISVSGVRDSPTRLSQIGVSRSNLEVSSHESPEVAKSLEFQEAQTKVKSKTAWIKEYLAFSSQAPEVVTEKSNTPRSSRFTNLERTLSNENDLRSWTRYVVGTEENESETAQKSEQLDLRVDDFTDYLVRHRGFNSSELQFLNTAVNVSYDEIEGRLDDIKDGNYERPKESIASRNRVALVCLLPMFLL